MKLTSEQQSEIDNLDVKSRVELVRNMLWNGVEFDFKTMKETGLESYSISDENMEWFLKGAIAMFDLALYRASNHYSGNPEVQKICDDENDYLIETMETCLELIHPDKLVEWKEIQV